MSREGEAVQGAVPREEGFASVLRRDAWVKPFFLPQGVGVGAFPGAADVRVRLGADVYLRLPGQRFGGG